MSRLPAVTGQRTLAVPQQLGFESLRVKGSRHVLRHPDASTTGGPSIVRQMKLSGDARQRGFLVATNNLQTSPQPPPGLFFMTTTTTASAASSASAASAASPLLPPLSSCTVAVIGLGYVGLPLAVAFATPSRCNGG